MPHLGMRSLAPSPPEGLCQLPPRATPSDHHRHVRPRPERADHTAPGIATRFRILIILVKTIAANCLTATTRTRFQVAANLMQLPASYPAIVTLRVIQVV
jgi:hypothetical protein